MESFLDMTLDRNLYIGVPVGSLFVLPFSVILLFQYHEEPDSP